MNHSTTRSEFKEFEDDEELYSSQPSPLKSYMKTKTGDSDAFGKPMLGLRKRSSMGINSRQISRRNIVRVSVDTILQGPQSESNIRPNKLQTSTLLKTTKPKTVMKATGSFDPDTFFSEKTSIIGQNESIYSDSKSTTQFAIFGILIPFFNSILDLKI